MANEFIARKGLIALDNSSVSGSLDVSGSLTIESSGSTVFEVIGSEGQLFSITDNLSGSLFAVSDVSGLPILEVFSDDTVKIGSFNNEAITVSGSHTTIGGTLAIPGFSDVSASLAEAVAGGGISDIVEDTTPQLGGNLDTNGKNISFGDAAVAGTDDTLTFGASNDLLIYHDGSDSFIKDNGTGDLRIQASSTRIEDYDGSPTHIQVSNSQLTLNAGNGLISVGTNKIGNGTDQEYIQISSTDIDLHVNNTQRLRVGDGFVAVSGSFNTTGSADINGTLSLPGFSDVSASLAAAVAGGDDLGNHTATQNLNMGGYAITNVGNVDGRDVSADGSKLDGIEAGADVTDTANVTAAGALMDSEVDANIKTLSLPANTTISTFGASLIDDATATNARTTLGLGSMATQTSTDYVSVNGDILEGDLDFDSSNNYNIINVGNLYANTISGSTFVSDGVTVVSTPDVYTVEIGQSAGGVGGMNTSIVANGGTQYGLFSNTGIQLTGSVDISSTLSIPGFTDVSASLAAAGTVDTTGTPANNQIARFTDSNTLKGGNDFTFDGGNMVIDALNSIVLNTNNNDAYFQIKGSGDDNLLQVNPQLNDRVGIGTSTPSQKLTVAGNISASGDLSIQGFTSVSASLAAAVAGGDNLGNHTATQNLNMGTYAITNVGNVDGVDVSTLKSDFDTLEGKTLVSGSAQIDLGSATGTAANASTASYIAGSNVDGTVTLATLASSAINATNATNVNITNVSNNDEYGFVFRAGTGSPTGLYGDSQVDTPSWNPSTNTMVVPTISASSALYVDGLLSIPGFNDVSASLAAASGGGGGNVSNTGTPVNDQIAVWTDATTIEGTTKLTFENSTITVHSANADGTGIEIYGGVYPTVTSWISPIGASNKMNFGDGTSGHIFDFLNNKIAFDGDATNTYIQANTDSPEDLEIHADQDIILAADNAVVIGAVTDVEDRISSYRTQIVSNGFYSQADLRYLTFNTTGETTGFNYLSLMPAPADGRVISISVWNQSGGGSTVMGFHKNSNATPSATDTQTLTTGVPVTFTFSSGNTFSQNDELSFSIDPTSTPNGLFFSIILEYDY